jgi:hypothetical protein
MIHKDAPKSRHKIIFKGSAYSEGNNLSDTPASCVYATSCLKTTDFAAMSDDT